MVFRIQPLFVLEGRRVRSGRTPSFAYSHLAAAFLLSILLLAAGAFAQTADRSRPKGKSDTDGPVPQIIVTGQTVSKTVPNTFDIAINLTDVSSGGLVSFQFNIAYNPSVVVPSGINGGCSTAGTISATASLSPFCNSDTPGLLLTEVHGIGTTSGSGTILNLKFATAPGATAGMTTALAFQDAFFFNSSGPVTKTLVDGRVTLVGPTAANVSVGGRVTDASGNPLRGVTVTLAGTDTTRNDITSPFGYYQFDDVTSGQTYVISAASKRFTFTPRLITVLDQLTTLDIVADP